MPSLAEVKLTALTDQGYTTGKINEREYAWLADQTGLTSGTLNEQWVALLTDLGYSGTLSEMQIASWIDMGATSSKWNEAAYWFWAEAGAYGPSVSIQRNNDPGYCDYLPPTTTDCTASETYTANDINFTNPANTWLWTLEPPVDGSMSITNNTAKTCTVTTTDQSVDKTLNLKVVATDSVSTDTANRTTTFIQKHTDLSVAPVFVGPFMDTTILVQNIAMEPFDASTRFSFDYVETWSLEGAWPTGISIDSSGVISGTPTDPIADYTGLTVRAENSAGFADSNVFTVTIAAGETAPVFSGTVPDQDIEAGVPYTLDLRPYFTGSAATYSTLDTLPTGLTLGTDGIITGTPSVEGETFSVTVTATNGAGADSTNAFGMDTYGEIVISTIPEQTFILDELYTHDMSQYVTGVVSLYQLGANWPPGFSIDPNTGVATGTATTLTTWTAMSIAASNPINFELSNAFDGVVQEAPSGPAFWALTPDETTYEMLGVREGVGDLTTTHTADLYAPDFEGVYREFAANEPVWSGGRVVTNFVQEYDDCSVTPWTKSANVNMSGTAGNITYNLTAPTAREVTQNISGLGLANGNKTLLLSFDITAIDDIDFRIAGLSGVTVVIPISAGQRRRVQAISVNNAATSFNIMDFSGGSGDRFIFHSCQLEDITGQTLQAASEVVPTETTVPVYATFANLNGNTVTDNVVTENTGAALPDVPYLQYYPAAENECLYSRDLQDDSEASESRPWASSGFASSDNDETGIDGSPNSASTCTDASATLLAYKTQSITILDDSNTNTLECWVKKDTDETRFPSITLIQSGGTQQYSRYTINTQTGAVADIDSVGTVAIELVSDGDWWKVLTSVANNGTGNTSAVIRIYPAYGTTMGVLDNAAQGSIIVGNVELHLNKTIAEVRGLGPIFTTTAAVATDATGYILDIANIQPKTAAWYFEIIPEEEVLDNMMWYSSDSSANQLLGIDTRFGPGTAQSYLSDNAGGYAPILNSPAGSITPYVLNKVGFSFEEAAQGSIVANGLWGNEESPTGGFRNIDSGTRFQLFKTTTPALVGTYKWRNFQRYDITSYAEGIEIINNLMSS